jgi:hypothetical protein
LYFLAQPIRRTHGRLDDLTIANRDYKCKRYYKTFSHLSEPKLLDTPSLGGPKMAANYRTDFSLSTQPTGAINAGYAVQRLNAGRMSTDGLGDWC